MTEDRILEMTCSNLVSFEIESPLTFDLLISMLGRPLFSGQSNIKSSATPLREFSCVRMCDVTPVTPQSIWNQQGPNRQEEKEALK